MKFRFFLPSLIRTGNQLLAPSRRVNQLGCCKTPGRTDQKHRNIDILSFDGSGTKVFMALSTLHNVMRVATIIRDDPESLSYLLDDQPENFLKKKEIREKLVKNFENVENPLHPTEVYDMVVGKSAGALAAFALVGGEKDPTDPDKRKPMPLHKCIDIIGNIRSIFKCQFKVPFCHYHKGNLEKKVKEIFEDSCLEDFKYAKISSNPSVGSVAGALTRQIQGVKEDNLVFFDGNDHANRSISVVKVLMASMNAPVDSGIGGDCPLVQAIPRAKVIFDKNPRSVLSVAPPAPKKQNHIADGHADYKDAQQQHGTNAKQRDNATDKVMFRRLSPRVESLKEFKILDRIIEKMTVVKKKETVSNKMFMADIVAVATTVVHKLLDKEHSYDKSYCETASAEVSAKLAYYAGRVYAEEKEYENALNSYRESEVLWNLVKPNYEKQKKLQTAEVHHHLGLCLKELEVFEEAASSFNKAIKDWKGNIDNALRGLAICSPNNAINDWKAKIAAASLERGICLTKSQRFDEANNCYKRAREIQFKLGHKNEVASICSLEATSRCEESKVRNKKENLGLALDLEKRALKIRNNILKMKKEKKECLLAIRADIAESKENLAKYLLAND